MNSKKITVEFVAMETPYGDEFVMSDSYLNIRGEVIRMWSTAKSGAVTKAPEELVKDGYKIVSRESREVAYEQGADGSWSKVNA
jgi:hypothetical protein